MEWQEFLKLIITGIITGVITYFFTIKKLKTQFNYKLLENLYEKRFNTYTKLLEITQDLGKNSTSYEEHKKARNNLIEWQKISGGFLLFNEETLIEFNKLKNILKRGKSIKEGYTNELKLEIFKVRNSFRGCLRKEFNFLHLAEKSI